MIEDGGRERVCLCVCDKTPELDQIYWYFIRCILQKKKTHIGCAFPINCVVCWLLFFVMFSFASLCMTMKLKSKSKINLNNVFFVFVIRVTHLPPLSQFMLSVFTLITINFCMYNTLSKNTSMTTYMNIEHIEISHSEGSMKKWNDMKYLEEEQERPKNLNFFGVCMVFVVCLYSDVDRFRVLVLSIEFY